MNPFVFITGAWNALLKNKKRSFLTMIGIVIGIASVSTIMSIGKGFETYLLDSLNPEEGDLLTVDVFFQADDPSWMVETNTPLFSDMDLQNVQFLPGVQAVETTSLDVDFAILDTVIANKKEPINMALIETEGRVVTVGRALDAMDHELEKRVAVVPASLLEETETLETALGEAIAIDSQLYTIVGLYEDGLEAGSLFGDFTLEEIEIPLATYMRYHNQENTANQISITVNRGFLPSEASEAAVALLEEEGSMKNRGTYDYFDLSAINDGLSKVLRGITLFIASVGGISLFIAGVGVMNMMYISVSERTKEIGIRRALGATQRSIQTQFVLEGVMMTSIGGVFGYIFGLIFSAIATAFLPFSTEIDWVTVLTALAVSVSVGLVFSYAPARAASKKEIIEIL